MSHIKKDRNKQIVQLRNKDPKKYTFGVLADMFRMARPSVHEIYHRDKEKYATPAR